MELMMAHVRWAKLGLLVGVEARRLRGGYSGGVLALQRLAKGRVVVDGPPTQICDARRWVKLRRIERLQAKRWWAIVLG
jgi:hypothetical protein